MDKTKALKFIARKKTKHAESLEGFRQKVKSATFDRCFCDLCREYTHGVGSIVMVGYRDQKLSHGTNLFHYCEYLFYFLFIFLRQTCTYLYIQIFYERF